MLCLLCCGCSVAVCAGGLLILHEVAGVCSEDRQVRWKVSWWDIGGTRCVACAAVVPLWLLLPVQQHVSVYVVSSACLSLYRAHAAMMTIMPCHNRRLHAGCRQHVHGGSLLTVFCVLCVCATVLL